VPQYVGDRVFIITRIENKKIACDPDRDTPAWNARRVEYESGFIATDV
jgi:hypothetical protein